MKVIPSPGKKYWLVRPCQVFLLEVVRTGEKILFSSSLELGWSRPGDPPPLCEWARQEWEREHILDWWPATTYDSLTLGERICQYCVGTRWVQDRAFQWTPCQCGDGKGKAVSEAIPGIW